MIELNLSSLVLLHEGLSMLQDACCNVVALFKLDNIAAVDIRNVNAGKSLLVN